MSETIFPKYNGIYKGNLHTHTTRSDGSYSIDQIIKGYQENGYQFLCISDHHNYYVSREKYGDTFIILDGMEGGVGYSNLHILAIADHTSEVPKRILPDSRYPINVEQTTQQTIDEYVAQGNVCIINHPVWTKLEHQDFDGLERYIGLEIYNNNCHLESLTGYAVDYWDYLLRKGKRIFGFATDDAHAEDMHCKVRENFGGWICVSAERLTQRDIVASMKKGEFYASNGPEIHSIKREGRTVHIITSSVQSIAFVTYPEHGKNVYDRDGGALSEASFQVHENTIYLRIEITDRAGKKAWSNPIFFK